MSLRTQLPEALARVPYGVVTASIAMKVYAWPRPQLKRLTDRGLLHRVAPGVFVTVPEGQVGRPDWRPQFERVVAGFAEAEFGPGRTALMGITAARVHHAVPRALATALVAAPRRRHPLTLTDRDATVEFVARRVERLATETVELAGGVKIQVTSVEQTVLDLARRPDQGNARPDAIAAIRVLWRRCDSAEIERIAGEQRLRGALAQAEALAK